MRFADPIFFLLLLYIPILILRNFHSKFKSPIPAIQFSGMRRALVALKKTKKPKIWIAPVLRILAITFFIIAAARPQQVWTEQKIEGEGIDILVALDISGSMQAADFQPKSRLDVAKNVIGNFIEGRIGDRIGLVVFAGKSFTQCPLTLDHKFLEELLSDVDSSMSQQQGTAIGLGLANAVNRLRELKSKSKIIIILTDGRNNAGKIDPLAAAEMAKNLQIKVYAIGVGKDRFPPMPMQDWFGNVQYVRSTEPMDPDEDLLKKIASITDGRFYRATDRDALQAVFQEIDQLEKSKFEMKVYNHYTELFLWPLVTGLALLILQLALALGRHQQLP